MKAVRRGNWEPTKNSRLCSKHFGKSCYIEGLSRRQLKTDAVLTIFEGYTKSYQPNGGTVVKPSARKSIHSHCGCTSANSRNMGRYGIPNVNNDQNICVSTGETGYDEVDNVMSKFARPTSPVPAQRRNIRRRHSCDVNNELSDDECDVINVLSKSSPPDISLCRDELYTSANDTAEISDLNNINKSDTSIHQFENESYNNSVEVIQQQLHKKEEPIIPQILIQGVVVFLFMCIPVLYAVYYPSKMEVVNVYDKISFYNDVRDLGEKYKVKDTAIMEFRAGVATIFEKRDTGSFIFAYNSNNNNFNPLKFDRFIEDIAAIASRYLRNYTKEVPIVVVDTINLKMQSTKEFMNTYEDDVAKTGVMLVKDVENLPPELAMAFHYYCDEYNPLVRQSAIFFTLNLAKCSNESDPKSTYKYIEECLSNKWSTTVGEDKIGALLNRVVNIVVDVTTY